MQLIDPSITHIKIVVNVNILTFIKCEINITSVDSVLSIWVYWNFICYFEDFYFIYNLGQVQ
jgi:hypothetical protein